MKKIQSRKVIYSDSIYTTLLNLKNYKDIEQMGDFQRGKNRNYKSESNKYAKNKSMVVKRKNSFNRLIGRRPSKEKDF